MVKIGILLKYGHLSDGRCILYMSERVRRTFQKAGAFIIPIVQVQDVDYMDTKYNEFSELNDLEKQTIDDYLDMIDGVVFPGGNKVTPYDKYLLERAIDRNIPVLGICLGMQLMSCYKKDGINLLKNDSYINHYQESDDILTHKVTINKNSKLFDIIGNHEISVNSFHNYHVVDNEFCSTVAISEDGYIEGIELNNEGFSIGVQWHPEISYDFDDNSHKLIQYFIYVCSEYRKNSNL